MHMCDHIAYSVIVGRVSVIQGQSYNFAKESAIVGVQKTSYILRAGAPKNLVPNAGGWGGVCRALNRLWEK